MREAYEENFRKIIKQGIESGEIKLGIQKSSFSPYSSTLRTLIFVVPKRGKLDVKCVETGYGSSADRRDGLVLLFSN